MYLEEQNNYSIKVNGKEIKYSSSYGYSHYDGKEDTDLNKILDLADKEMYLQKESKNTRSSGYFI